MMKTFFLLGICFIPFLTVFAQNSSFDNPEYFVERIPKNPEVAELGRFGAIPVGKYSGTANVGVPIHAIDFDGLKIPISIAYNSSGIRTSQEATSVGLGWNLSAGAMISRRIVGFDDVLSGTAADFSSMGYIFTPEIQDQNPAIGLISANDSTYLIESHKIEYEVDVEPDIFTVNLFGGSYKFTLSKALGSDIVEGINYDDKDLIIRYTISTKSFEVIDANGFHYFFSSKEISDPFRYQENPFSGSANLDVEEDVRRGVGRVLDRGKIRNSISNWCLDRIESPFNRVLNFEYEDGSYLTYPNYSHSFNLQPDQSASNIFVFNNDYRGQVNIDCNITLLYTKYLTKIHGDFGEVNFELTDREDLYTREAHASFIAPDLINGIFPNIPTNRKKVSSVIVKNNADQVIKTAQFSYSYFNADRENDPEKEKYLRLKLDEVAIDDKVYSFEYEQPNALPEKDTPSVDFWGFYNGEENLYEGKKLRLPNFGRYVRTKFNGITEEKYIVYEGANKSSNFDFGKIGLLNKITYPTKGSSSFEYEGNSATVATPTGSTVLTNYGNSTDYKYNYQYLERANGDSAISTLVNSGDTFTITGSQNLPFTNNFEITLDLQCQFNCASANGQPIVEVTELSSGNIFYAKFSESRDLDFGLVPSQNGASVTLKGYLRLDDGDYSLNIRTQYDNSQSSSIVGISVNNVETNIFSSPALPAFPNLKEFEVGGARIKSITNRGIEDEFISKKTYDYTQDRFGNLMSSGVLMDELIYHSKSGYFDYTPEGYNGTRLLLHSSNMLVRTGSHLGYSKVTERSVSSDGTPNGRKECFYHNTVNDHYTRLIGNVPEFGEDNFLQGIGGNTIVSYGNVYYLGITPDCYEHLNGRMKEEVLYNNTNDRVKRTTYEYETIPVSTVPTWKVYYGAVNIPHYYRYNLFGKKALLKNTVTQDYFDNNFVEVTMSYKYLPNESGKHFYPIETSMINSENETIRTETIYPTESNRANMIALANQNRKAMAVEVKSYNDDVLMNRQVTDYELYNAIYQPDVVMTQKSSSTGTLNQRVSFERYDEFGNLLQYRLNNNTQIAYIWGYKEMYPVAKIENATYEQVLATGIDLSIIKNSFTDDEVMRNELNKIRLALPQALVSSYTFKPSVGMSSMTDTRGYTVFYEYDSSRRLIRVKDAEGFILSENEYHYKSQQ